ncbi:hypothetical protein ACSS6W_007297 [Trichoderma asperelloides]
MLDIDVKQIQEHYSKTPMPTIHDNHYKATSSENQRRYISLDDSVQITSSILLFVWNTWPALVATEQNSAVRSVGTFDTISKIEHQQAIFLRYSRISVSMRYALDT